MTQFQMTPMTPAVKKILIAMASIWVLIQIVLDKFVGLNISPYFMLQPFKVVNDFWAWQLLTYMFLHSLSPFHIFFNALMLWFVGAELEKHWGTRFFAVYFFTCGVGAAAVYCFVVAIYAVITGNNAPLMVPVLGASGGLFGLLVAYGIIFSERVIYFMGLFPLKAKYFVMVAAALDFSSLLTTGLVGGEVAYLAHLGGALVGFMFLWIQTRKRLSATRSNLKKSGSPSLKLVVDNEKSSDKGNPKYWN